MTLNYRNTLYKRQTQRWYAFCLTSSLL